ncbi:MAG: hypothetical protein LQ347_003724 [Umbilicaria vellea]|nr:MAG: hypothetical protein LQ347_003724 [Umbilicaria vellea]
MAFFEAESPASLVRKQTQSIGKDQDDRAFHDVALDGDDDDDEESDNSKGPNKNRKNKSKNKNKVAKKTNKKEEEIPVCRWMVPYCGKAKTFEDVRVVLNVVDNYIETNMWREKLVFPHIEILPHSTPTALPRRAARNTQRRCNPQLKASNKRKASDSTSESGDVTPPTSRKRRFLAEDSSDESGETSTVRPRKRRSMAGGNTNEGSTGLPPKRRSATGGNTNQSKATSRSPPKRPTLARGRKTQPAAMSATKQGKQAVKKSPATGGRRR